jgi:predicted esterase
MPDGNDLPDTLRRTTISGMKPPTTTPLQWFRLAPLAVACGFAILAPPASAQPLRGHQPQVAVGGPTRLDWIFALANQSLPQAPDDWLKGYDSTAQRYELYVPASVDPRKPAPLVLFISAGGGAAGLADWRPLCDRAGIIFASPHGAGNNTTGPLRTRIILDVLDDVRRRFAVDADRTYLGGFSGGARVACTIAFALPEYFGGVVPVCGAESLRDESWLRRRVVDRLSVALVTGENDFNRGELERFRGPVLSGVGVRTKVWTVAGLGHAVPPAELLAEAFAWLEEGTAARRRLAQQWPAMRLSAEPPTREASAAALFAEAKQRLQTPATLYSGLMQLQGLSVRWADLPVAEEAVQLLTAYDAKPQRPWEEDDLAEQRRFLWAEARGLDAYASGDLPKQYEAQRAAIAAGALERWQTLLADDPQSPAGQEAQRRIPALTKLAEKDP